MKADTPEKNEEMNTATFVVVTEKTRKRILELIDELNVLTEFLKKIP